MYNIEKAKEDDLEEYYKIILSRCKWFEDNKINQWKIHSYPVRFDVSYFKKQMKENKLFIAKKDGVVVGGFLLKEKDYDYWSDCDKVKAYSIDYTQDINFIKGNNTLYLSYNSNNKLIVVDIINNKILIEKSFNYLANPKFAFYNNKIFVAYSDYFGSDKKSKLSSIDSNGIWKIELSLNMEQTNIHDIKVYNDNLYAIYGGNNIKPTLVKCHNSNCNIFNTVPIDSYLTLSLNVNDNIYVSYIKNTVDDKKTYVLKSDGISYSLYNDNLGTGILNFKIINDDNNLYSLINISDSLYLKKKIMKNN